MKVIFRQYNSLNDSPLSRFRLKNCYFRELVLDAHSKDQSLREHRHLVFELHILSEGHQEYLINNKRFSVSAGQFLLIPPNVLHTNLLTEDNTIKYSATFEYNNIITPKVCSGETPESIVHIIKNIKNEYEIGGEFSQCIIENNVFEIIVTMLRKLGVIEKKIEKTKEDNTLISLAKQYINDNIEQPPVVSDVAEYCHLSTKQLTRIFNQFEGTSPGDYISKQRGIYITKLISDDNLTLKQISNKMNFSSEYYFNTFFKKIVGMPPGEYKTIHINKNR